MNSATEKNAETTSQERHICLISGGKDSTALAVYLRERRPELEVEYVFCDTHKELPETYDYLALLEGYLGRPIVRLCSAQGERGFDYWLQMYRGLLPSPSVRWCTRQLKIKPFEDYVGDDPTHLYVGIRADEMREGYISTKSNITPHFPFKEDGITKPDVVRILDDAGVGLPKYYEWRSRSGCYFCFFQRRSEWVGLMERHPEFFELAKEYEKVDEGFTWSQGESLVQLSLPERVGEIKEQESERRRQRAERRRKRPVTLAQMVVPPDDDDDDDAGGCLICHL